MTPRVSVLLPARNAAATLGETLASLQAQTLGDFEVVLVDDHSRDDTVAVARRAWGSDARLHIVRPPQQGLVEALRAGLDECRADLVARLDADDIAEPERLAAQAELLSARRDLHIAGSFVRCFADAPLGDGYRLYETWLNSLVDHDD